MRTFAVATRIPKNSIAPALYWDTGNVPALLSLNAIFLCSCIESSAFSSDEPYHYTRTTPGDSLGDPDHDYIIVGGEDLPTGSGSLTLNLESAKKYERLEDYARALWPGVIEPGEFMFRWSGQVNEPSDLLAFIG
jgi:hypothetical protein